MKLIITESPTKAKTIKRFIGKGFLVESSYGHIRDLPSNNLGVDVEKNFKPTYVIPNKAKKTISTLKKSARKADEIILATDEDREGEAIAWHLAKALGLNEEKTERIVFHEITKKAIKEALEKPRRIDIKLVDAQQARRVLDRLVGYKLSPFLWKKIAKGLSAGRVQSVAVKFIVEREREIENFKKQEYWSIIARLQKRQSNPEKNEFEARLIKKDGKEIKKLDIKNKKEAQKIVTDLKGAQYKISDIQKKEIRKHPLPPFTTSTLQQDAWKRFGFTAKQTMRLAQQLYEGVELGNQGSQGLITYMRTDSLNLSKESITSARNYIGKRFGKNYIPPEPKVYKTKSKGAQEAHEAIRPTNPEFRPDEIKQYLDKNQIKLYTLIWQRFIACQMSSAVLDSTTANIEAKNYNFRTNGSTIKFNGFLKVYPIKLEEKLLPELKKNEILNLVELTSNQHFTQPPPRYTEASLVKTLEANGIGRPSTYAPIMSTIQNRNYVEKDENKRFVPTDIGLMVNDLLVKHFQKIVDTNFTALIEEDLDEIAKGKMKWKPVVRMFYEPFEKNLKKKYEEVEKKEFKQDANGEICEKCSKPMVVKMGRFGKFLACSGFPDCKNTKGLEKTTGVKCPKCPKGEIIEKKSKRKRLFYGCNKYPDCDFALWQKPTGEHCPKCQSLLTYQNKNKIKCSDRECGFEKESNE